MFEVNWATVVNWLMPPVLRTAFNLNLLTAFLSPFQALYNQFKIYRDANIYTLNHNSQVCYLQGALNDAFDVDQRRIRIDDAGGENVTLLNIDTDEQPLMIDDDGTGYFITHNDSAYNGGSWDFIVVIPYVMSSSELYRLKALVNYYKLAGKRYDVIVG